MIIYVYGVVSWFFSTKEVSIDVISSSLCSNILPIESIFMSILEKFIYHTLTLITLGIIKVMKIENEDVLDNLIICHQCHTLHKDVPIKDGTKACCRECSTVLYRFDSKLCEHGLALGISSLIFFFIANFFPLVKIEILGHEQFITIIKTITSLFENGFFIVGGLLLFLIFIFPLMIMFIYITIFLLLKYKYGKELSKNLLVLLSHISPWSMLDIFLVSILVALVKLIGYAEIHMGIAFWALIVFVMLDIYLTKSIQIIELWMLRKKVFLKEKQDD